MKNIIFKNIGIAFLAVLFYSPGFFCLRPWDTNIFRASLAISLGVLLIGLFSIVNYPLIENKKKTEGIQEAIHMLKNSKTTFSNPTLLQYKRLQDILDDLNFVIKDRFEEGSLSYQKFYGVVEALRETVEGNIVKITNRSLLFSENEKTDRKLKIKNEENIKKLLEHNNQLLSQGNQLIFELSSGEEDNHILEEIKQLTEEVKYYKENL